MTTPPPLPRYAVISYAGKRLRVRVLSYHRNGYFFLENPANDTLPLYRHRASLTFVP